MLNSLLVKSILDKKIESSCGSDDYMTKENPTGTGAFSMNRKAGTEIGLRSVAEGFHCEASGANSHAEGSYTEASASSSHAEGDTTTASGESSHAEGRSTTASAYKSHAEGDTTTASGESSHAEGYHTKASGPNSHAEGTHTEASGYYSHAEGLKTKASGSYSHSGGNSTIAGYKSQTAIGEYNENKEEDIFEVGNGTSNTARSNALELKKTGDLKIGGNYIDGSGNVLSMDSANEYTDQKIADLINGAPTTLDTLKEIADAMEESQGVVDALNKAIGAKANSSDLTAHTSDTNNPHSVTKEQLGLGNVVESEVATDFSEAETPKFQQTIDDVLDSVNELKSDLTTFISNENLYDGSTLLNGYIDGMGVFKDTVDATFCSKDFIKVKPLTMIDISASFQIEDYGFECFDENKNHLCTIYKNNYLPANAHYIKFNIIVHDKNELDVNRLIVFVKDDKSVNLGTYRFSKVPTVYNFGRGAIDSETGNYYTEPNFYLTNYIDVRKYEKLVISNFQYQKRKINTCGITFWKVVNGKYVYAGNYYRRSEGDEGNFSVISVTNEIIDIPSGVEFARITYYDPTNIPNIKLYTNKYITDHVEEIDVSDCEYVHKSYSTSGNIDTDSDIYLTTKYHIYVGKGNAYRISIPKGWKVNVNYHHTADSETRSDYVFGFSDSITHVAPFDYISLVFCLLNKDGVEKNISSMDTPENFRLFIVNSGEIDPRDFGAVYDGSTDCTQAFQTCLDYGTVNVNVAGIAVVSPIMISQDKTTIKLHPNFQFMLKSNANDPLIYTIGSRYKNDDDDCGAYTVKGIYITGGIWNGNGDNQSWSSGTVITPNHSEMHWWSEMLFLDVSDVTIHDTTIKNPFKFGLMMGNATRFDIRNIYCDYYTRKYVNMDGLHFGGSLSHGVIDHVYGCTHDDMVAINVDGDYDSVKADMPRRGSAEHIIIRNISSDNGYRAVRLLCGTEYTCDDIIIDGIQGIFKNRSAIHISNWGEDAYHKNITVRNIQTISPDSIIQVGEDAPTQIHYTSVENLFIDSVTMVSSQANTNGLIKSFGGATINNINISNVFINGEKPISPLVKANVGTAFVNNINSKISDLTIFETIGTAFVNNVILPGGQLYSNTPSRHNETNILL